MAGQAPKWSLEDIEVLRDLAAQNMRPSLIAARLGRSEAGVKGKAIAEGLELVGERSIAGMSLRRFEV